MSIPIELLDVASNNEANADILSLSNEKILKTKSCCGDTLPNGKNKQDMKILRNEIRKMQKNV